MRIDYPKDIQDLKASIPREYFIHPETAPDEYKKRIELWKNKTDEYDAYVRKELWGF